MAEPARVVLVTGASAGIGRACADRLAAANWTVVGASRRGTAGNPDGSPGTTASWAGLVMDVDDEDNVRSGVDGIVREHGRLDAVVAAAGWGVAGAAEFTGIAEARAQFDTNFWGCVRVVQAALGHMREQTSGRILLVSSLAGVIGIPFQAYYSTSKFALEGFGESLAYEVAPFGISVTLVQPGNIKTDFTANRQICTEADSGGVYAAAMTRAVAVMERDEANGAPAGQVAATVQRVLESGRPPRRVSAGKTAERAGVMAKRLLPFRIFEAAAKGSLGVS
jgi:NAD(P)-dependent dehydrogenase (short-subunit alcohol dehydrogenase family)